MAQSQTSPWHSSWLFRNIVIVRVSLLLVARPNVSCEIAKRHLSATESMCAFDIRRQTEVIRRIAVRVVDELPTHWDRWPDDTTRPRRHPLPRGAIQAARPPLSVCPLHAPALPVCIASARASATLPAQRGRRILRFVSVALYESRSGAYLRAASIVLRVPRRVLPSDPLAAPPD